MACSRFRACGALLRVVFGILPLSLALSACSESSDGSAGTGGTGDPLECDFDSTYAAIQANVFEAEGCAVAACHGDNYVSSGGLDLRAEASFDALVRAPSEVQPELDRVFPGDQDLSLLYQKLSKTTEELAADGLGQAMPLTGASLSEAKLQSLARWIRGGAPRDGIVEGTLEGLGCDGAFTASPNKIEPLPPPAPDEGVQFYSGGWALDSETEDEVCFATYYDFTDLVPPEYQIDCDEFGEGRKCFAFGRNELAQDGQSHHSIITVYTGDSDPNGGEWGEWSCLGGDRAGETCDPTEVGACGDRSACTSPVLTRVGCIGYPGPQDFAGFGSGAFGGVSGSRVQLSGAQESTFISDPPEGVYSRLPLEGFVAWNSHAFNLTQSDTTIEQWVNLSFVPAATRRWLQIQIYDTSEIFSMSPVPPFEKREVCMSFTVPRYARLTSLSSHMHTRGELFRIWHPPNAPCASSFGCLPPDREPEYVSRLYDDPVYTLYEPPLPFDGMGAADRTFVACATYDNGADDPMEVKRESTKPDTPTCNYPVAYCGCPERERVCLFGPDQGASCDGDDDACGGDGVCDACPVRGGITTVDEMLIPLGSYFVQPPAP